MLETIREFALEELGRRGGAEPARAALAEYLLGLMERAEPHLRTGAQLEWLERLRPEQDSLHAAVTHVCDTGDAVTAFRLGAASGWFWTFDDNHAEAAQWLERILAVPDPTGSVPSDLRLVVRTMHVVNSGFAGDFQFAYWQLAELAELAAAAPPGGHPFVQLIEPVILMFQDEGERGAALVAERLAGPVDPWTRGMLLTIRAHLLENDGDVDGMIRELTLAADEFREIGERWGLAMTLASLADATARRGDFAAAVACFEDSIALHSRLGINSSEAYLLVSAAALRRHTDGPEVARALLRAWVEGRGHASRDLSHAMLELGHLARATGDLDEAERDYAEAWRLQEVSPLVAPQYKAIVLAAHAETDLVRGRLPEARDRLRAAVTLARSARDMPVVARVAITAAGLALAEADPGRAAVILGAAQRLAGGRDHANVDWTLRLEGLRAELGAAAFDAAHRHGAGLPREEALDLITP